jgi:hypothetical protein
MSRETAGIVAGTKQIREAVCIHTDKVYDACKDKDCVVDARVYLTAPGQEIVDRAINVKFRKADIIWVYTDVEEVPFNRGYFTVDLKFFFKIYLDVFTGVGRPVTVEGLATFDKKVILFGSEGQSKIYTSKFRPNEQDVLLATKNNLPKAIVEVVEPIALSAKLVERHCHHTDCNIDVSIIPEEITNVFDDDLVGVESDKNVYVTLGLFSIIKLERSVQLLIPVYDFCVPDKECIGSTEDNPCELFDTIKFPVDEFFPPNAKKFDAINSAEVKSAENVRDRNRCCCN